MSLYAGYFAQGFGLDPYGMTCYYTGESKLTITKHRFIRCDCDQHCEGFSWCTIFGIEPSEAETNKYFEWKKQWVEDLPSPRGYDIILKEIEAFGKIIDGINASRGPGMVNSSPAENIKSASEDATRALKDEALAEAMKILEVLREKQRKAEQAAWLKKVWELHAKCQKECAKKEKTWRKRSHPSGGWE